MNENNSMEFVSRWAKLFFLFQFLAQTGTFPTLVLFILINFINY